MIKKEKCEKCKRTIRKKNLRENKATGELMCSRCINRYGENKFYDPLKKKRNVRITNYSITENERKFLSCEKSFKDINILCKGLRTLRKGKKRKERLEREKKRREEESKEERSRKFLEGLK